MIPSHSLMKALTLTLLLSLAPTVPSAQERHPAPASLAEWNVSISRTLMLRLLPTDETKAKKIWGRFAVTVRFSAMPDGTVTRVAIAKGSGRDEIDRLVESGFRQVKLPPFTPDMPRSEQNFLLPIMLMFDEPKAQQATTAPN